MIIFEALAWDHARVSVLLARIERTDSFASGQRRELLARVREVLGPHQSFEDEVLFPELLAVKLARNLVLDAYEEHRVAGRLLDELGGLEASDPEWLARVSTLRGLLERGMHVEETGIFGKAYRMLGHDQGQLLADRYRLHIRRFEPEAPGAAELHWPAAESAVGVEHRASAAAVSDG